VPLYIPLQNNQFFSIPVSIIRRRANLPSPAPGQRVHSAGAARGFCAMRSLALDFTMYRSSESLRRCG
jgi:hypothetical protein